MISNLKTRAYIQTQEDVQEDFGWKLVHGEVFRSPQNPLILSICIGNGAQLCAMVGITLRKFLFCAVLYVSYLLVSSVCTTWILIPIKPWFFGDSDDGMLDILWLVSDQ